MKTFLFDFLVKSIAVDYQSEKRLSLLKQ